MGFYDAERATSPGIVDSDALATDAPLSAHVLREIARTANWMRDADATMLVDAWPGAEALGIAATPEDQVLTIYHGVPSRMIHTRALVRLRARVQSGASVRWTFRTAGGEASVDQSGTGLSETVQVYMPLAPAEHQTVEVACRATLGTTASGIGSPASWADAVTTTYMNSNAEIVVPSASWVPSAFTAGDKAVRVSQASTGQILATVPIVSATATSLRTIRAEGYNSRGHIGATWALRGDLVYIIGAAACALESLHIEGMP